MPLPGSLRLPPSPQPSLPPRPAGLGDSSHRAIHHDLCNFLHPILVLSESLLQGAPEGRDPTRALEVIHASARRCLALLQQLEPAEVGSASGLEIQDLNAVLQELEPTLAHGLPPGLRLVLDLEPSLPFLALDRLQIQRMLFNLVKNAREALDGPGLISVRTALQWVAPQEASTLGITSGQWVCLEVQDDGPGVPPQHLSQVFSPHFTTKGPGRGHGLGLSGLATMVRAHQGSVRCQNAVPHGARFQIFLPVPSPAI